MANSWRYVALNVLPLIRSESFGIHHVWKASHRHTQKPNLSISKVSLNSTKLTIKINHHLVLGRKATQSQAITDTLFPI